MRIVATPLITHAPTGTGAEGDAGDRLGRGLARNDRGRLVDGPVAILAAFTVAMVALSPMLSLSDAYALSGLGARGRSYGPVRLWGSVAFIAGNVGAGFILEAIAPGHLIWLIVFALVLVVAAASALDPVEVGSSPVAAAPPIQSPKILLRNPRFSPSCWRRA